MLRVGEGRVGSLLSSLGRMALGAARAFGVRPRLAAGCRTGTAAACPSSQSQTRIWMTLTVGASTRTVRPSCRSSTAAGGRVRGEEHEQGRAVRPLGGGRLRKAWSYKKTTARRACQPSGPYRYACCPGGVPLCWACREGAGRVDLPSLAAPGCRLGPPRLSSHRSHSHAISLLPTIGSPLTSWRSSVVYRWSRAERSSLVEQMAVGGLVGRSTTETCPPAVALSVPPPLPSPDGRNQTLDSPRPGPLCRDDHPSPLFYLTDRASGSAPKR